ncbi:hypothetical protein GTO89_04435 [Heliobacterium gestii]|uniref:Uncharacterized protein n=1 Tax=Heliomicrobium gestii TaxID=2699 RepID=A0A845L7T7_HELGE|nr:hypothetical protein [Heliomicrobium gestii]MBM7866860.1 hypothetical protein [Heliomicrobium gestii]MZP42288.1 hypothetical protein [Heliomicrobium gestii]
MNKMKLLLDVVKAMKEKDVFKGALTVEGARDGVTVLKFGNDFEVSDTVKAKVCAEVNDGDRVLKHESSTEFSRSCGGHGFHRRHFHHGFHRHGFHGHSFHGHCRLGRHGIKGFFERMNVALTLLSHVQVEAQEDKTVLVSFDSDALPAEMRATIHQRIKERHLHCGHGFERAGAPVEAPFHGEHGGHGVHGGHGSHGPLGMVHRFLPSAQGRVRCKALINEANEIIMIAADMEGKRQGAEEAMEDVKLNAQVRFVW